MEVLGFGILFEEGERLFIVEKGLIDLGLSGLF